MAASFPVTFPSALTTTSTTTLSDAQHNDNLHVKDRDEIRAVQSKVGLGTASATASGTTALVGTGGTQSGWYQVGPQHIAPGTTTMLKLFGTVLSGTLGTISITSIPQTYARLMITVFGRTNFAGTSNTAIFMTFNGDTAANYSQNYVNESSSAVTSSYQTGRSNIGIGLVPSSSLPAGLYSQTDYEIPNYAGTLLKSVKAFTSSWVGTAISDGNLRTGGGLWGSTAAIGTIDFVSQSGSFVPGTRVEMWGVPA